MSSAPSDHQPTPTKSDEPGSLPTTLGEVKKLAGLRYQILRPHDKGGIGEVFVVLDQEPNRNVALKEIQERCAADEPSRRSFVREAETASGVEQPRSCPFTPCTSSKVRRSRTPSPVFLPIYSLL